MPPLAAAGLTGALLLVAAELAPLYRVHLTSSVRPVASVSAGAHHAYALLPVAALAAALALLAWRQPGRSAPLRWPRLASSRCSSPWSATSRTLTRAGSARR